jgi:hypothetical protein
MIFALEEALLFQFCVNFIDRGHQWYNVRRWSLFLKRAVVVGEGSSRLGLFSRGPPLSLFDMFLATGRG